VTSRAVLALAEVEVIVSAVVELESASRELAGTAGAGAGGATFAAAAGGMEPSVMKLGSEDGGGGGGCGAAEGLGAT